VTTKTIIQTAQGAVVEEIFTPAAGGNTLYLRNVPDHNYPIRLFVNGVLMTLGPDFTVAGVVVSFTTYVFSGTETFQARYLCPAADLIQTLTQVKVSVTAPFVSSGSPVPSLAAGDYFANGGYTTTPPVAAWQYGVPSWQGSFSDGNGVTWLVWNQSTRPRGAPPNGAAVPRALGWQVMTQCAGPLNAHFYATIFAGTGIFVGFDLPATVDNWQYSSSFTGGAATIYPAVY